MQSHGIHVAPFSNLASGFSRNTRRKIRQASGALQSFMKSLLKPVRDLTDHFSRQATQLLNTTKQSAGPLDLPRNIFPRARSTRPVDCDLLSPTLNSIRAVTSAPLYSDSLSLFFPTSLICHHSIIRSVLAPPHHHSFPVFSSPSIDPKLRHHGLLDDCAPWQGTHSGIEFSTCFLKPSSSRPSSSPGSRHLAARPAIS